MSASGKAVFLSYASQDAEAARRICEALRAAGVEVWFDQSELVGGDAWDQKIRKQIKECALFVPIISANTQARAEGYFRLEWLLAVERSRLMADDQPFFVPLVIDDTMDSSARVPERFRERQWTRLRGGHVDAGFCDRVKKLLHGSQLDSATLQGAIRGASSPPSSRGTGGTRGWYFAIGAVVAIAFALALWHPWRNADSSVSPGAKTSAASPLTEAQKLIQQAHALIDGDFLAGRESFRLAEELCQRAAALDPSDGAVWATSARVALEMVARNYDRTEKRRELARSHAERALRLAPDSSEAGLAVADVQLAAREAADAERRYRALLETNPRDARAALGLARALSALRRVAEASEIRLNHPAFGGRDPRPLIDEADELRNTELARSDLLVDRAQAIAPSLAGYFYKFANVVNFWGDLQQGRAVFEQLPARVLQEDSIAGTAAWLWIRLGDGDEALRVLERVPRDYIEEFRQEWPKGFLTGWAHHVARRPAAAQSEWKRALAVVEARLAADSDKPRLLRYRALLLALTGKSEEAEKTYRLFREQSRFNDTLRIVWDAEFQLALGRAEEAIADLQRTRRIQPWELTLVRLDPAFAPIRADPRVAAIIGEGMGRMDSMRRSAAPAGATPPDANRTAADKSVAVLAFENLSDDKANEYFSDGISEELLNVLAKVPGLRVAARTSAFYFKGRNATAQEIGQKLGVAHLVDGSVRKAGTKVRILARLSKVDTGEQIWSSEPYEDELKDVFALQDRIARDIAGKLQLKLALNQQPKREVNPEAIEAYLLGMQLWARQTPEDGTAAVRHFQRAIEIDPKFPEAYSGLSMAYPFLSLPHDGKLRRTREFAQRAIDLDPLFADGYVARGLHTFFAEWNWPAAEADFRRAIELNPNSRLALESCAFVLAATSRFEEAIALARKSVQRDPLSPLGRYSLVIYLYAGRPAEAVTALEAKRDVYGPTAQLGLSYVFAGKTDQAVIELEAAERAAPAAEATPALGYAYARAGRRAEALQVLAKWDQTPRNLAVGYWYPRAWIHVGLDDKSRALEDLERGYAQRDTWMVWSKVDPIFAPLHDEPRYQALLKKMGLDR